MNFNKKYELGKLVAIYLIPPILTLFIISFILLNIQKEQYRDILSQNEHLYVEAKAREIEAYFSKGAKDARYLSSATFVKQYIETPNAWNAKQLGDSLFNLLLLSDDYSNIRILDTKGQETVRLNKLANEVLTVNKKELQNKGKRSYFIKSKSLTEGQVYVTSPELNIENGRIEIPINPVVRYVSPIYKNGKHHGFVVINQSINHLLTSIKYNKNSSMHPVWVMTSKNIWINGPQGVDEWLPNQEINLGSNLDISNKFINAIKSENLKNDGHISFYDNKNHFAITRINNFYRNSSLLSSNLISEDLPWNIISFVENADEATYYNVLKQNIFRINAITFVLFLLVSFFSAKKKLENITISRELDNEKAISKSFFEHANFSAYIKDLDGKFVLLNTEAEKVIGLEREKILGKSVLDFYPEEIARPIHNNDIEVLHDRKVVTHEESVGDRTFISNKFPIYDSSYTIVGLGGFSSEITAQKDIERALHETVIKFESVFRSTKDYICFVDSSGSVIEANANFERLVAHNNNEIDGQKIWLIPAISNNSERIKTAFEQTLQNIHQEFELEIEINNKSTILLVSFSNTSLGYFILKMHDITDKSELINKLQRSNQIVDTINQIQRGYMSNMDHMLLFEDFLRKTIELANGEYGFIGVVLEEDGNKYLKTHAITNIAWNKETRDYYDQNIEVGLEFRSLDNLFGEVIKTGSIVISNDPENDPRSCGIPEGHPPLENFLGIPVYYGNTLLGEIGIANRKGGFNHALAQELQAMAQVYGYIINNNMNNQKQLQMQNALESSEQQMRALIDAAPDAIMMMDKNFNIHLLNRQAEIMFGYTKNEILGQSVNMLLDEQLHELHTEHMKEYIKNPTTGNMIISGNRRELFARLKNGSTISVEISLSPLKLDDEQFIIASVNDITEKKRIDKQLQESQKMESIGQLTGGIAHDFNNFLGVIIGNLDLITDTVDGNEKALERINKATQAALRGAELTKRLLAFSRRQTLIPKPVNMNNIVVEMLDMLPRTLGSNIIIKNNLQEDLWMCNIDPHQLENVILNLAINARDAMKDGGTLILATQNEIKYTTSEEVVGGEVKPGQYVMFEITDTGSGISKKDIEKIFEPFYTTKPEGQGTGLGLAMVYGFVKQSNGYIKLYSEVGYGTSFKILIPRLRTNKHELDFVKPVTDRNKLFGTETILVVDDEKDLLDIASSQLQKYGYTVYSAENSQQALEILSDVADIDLVFTDIVMPGELNGIMLAEKVREINPNIKVLLTSGFPKDALKGASDIEFILNKPYRDLEMLEKIHETLNP